LFALFGRPDSDPDPSSGNGNCDVVVARLPIAEIGPHDKHVAGEAEREQSFILETNKIEWLM
jgi:hypothetical protein